MIEDDIVTDVNVLLYQKVASEMLLYPTIFTLVTPYNVSPDEVIDPVNDPVPLYTLVIHDTVIPDFPYNVLPVPGMTLGI